MRLRVCWAALLWAGTGWTADAEPRGASLAECERAALEGHPSVRLAREQVRVAELKRAEAYRAVWPNVNLKAEATRGESVRQLGTPDFNEESYGVQLTQPIFQGGRLYRTYRQARAAWESEQGKLEKARQEVVFGVREATWNLARALASQDVLARALAELGEENRAADRLFANDVIPRQTYLTVTAQHQQAALAVDGARAELESRLWQWTAALGLKEPPDYRPAVLLSSFTSVGLTLERCLATGRERQPDLLIQRKAAEAARHGDRAGRGLYWPKLSFNGFYGRSGGAFENENFELREDYQFGGQLVQYFGGSTLNLTGLEQRTSPKIGQTSRTQSKTGTASLGLLDGLRQKTEKAEAAAARDQAEVQWERTRMEVDNGVREAYANWRKAVGQRRIAENELSLARTEFDVSRIKSAHREAPLSERAVARNKLAQAEVAFLEAQAGCHAAEAALSRASGDPELFSEGENP